MPDRHGKYSYFDTPDGQDAHKKAWYLCKNLGKLGFLTGTLDALNITKAQTKMGVLLVYGKHMGLLVGAGLAFTAATTISLDLRKKDDEVNHAMGAVAVSSLFAAYTASPFVMASLIGITVPLAYLNKTAFMDGVSPWHDFKRVPKTEYPITYYNFELDKREDTIKKRYDEKNEEYFKKLNLDSRV
ncbi:hypothetical protein EB796_021943 [Bugula neritina]|uniref:NADH dehydrogenase [ubiquinone] 1 alpha subcomplex subunit 11 n=1 Tax=Bugula neritina TaxID=10212 RepID=A0A7J7J0V8_BUGNE|nr:hypothetical protein EB796_021943 [Bugula neritina]